MAAQGSPAPTRMLCNAEEGFPTTSLSKEEGSSSIIYEIIMLCLSGSLLLLFVISLTVRILQSRCTTHHSSKDLSVPAVVLENAAVTSNCSDKISTVNLTGPVCLSYVSNMPTGCSEEMVSISEVQFLSFAASVTPPGSPLEQ